MNYNRMNSRNRTYKENWKSHNSNWGGGSHLEDLPPTNLCHKRMAFLASLFQNGHSLWEIIAKFVLAISELVALSCVLL